MKRLLMFSFSVCVAGSPTIVVVLAQVAAGLTLAMSVLASFGSLARFHRPFLC